MGSLFELYYGEGNKYIGRLLHSSFFNFYFYFYFLNANAQYGINKRYNRVISFLGETSHESARFTAATEWLSQSKRDNDCAPNYDGGCLYCGRGFIQLTHKYSYNATTNTPDFKEAVRQK